MAEIKEPGGPAASAAAQDQLDRAKKTQELSSSDDVDKRVAQLQEADLQQKIAKGISDAAAQANQQMNETLSAMLQPIYDAIQQFKEVPPKLRKLVDVDGAANGMYDQLGKMQASLTKFQTEMTSAEVPITLDDYRADPQRYENLMALEYQNNDLTEEDCLSSGYTKVRWSVSETRTQELMDQFPAPQDRDVVGKAMEKAVGSAIKTAWQVVRTPVQTIASIANIGPIPDMIQSTVDAVDSIVKIASQSIPEEKLDEMLAQKTLAQEKAKAEAEKAQSSESSFVQGAVDSVQKALSQAADAASQAYDGVKAGISESFADFEAPTIPDDVKETIEDFKDAIVMLKDNISNIYIVVILKMVNAVFSCFNQIIGILGVPTIPDPLGKIPQVLADATKIMQFIMGLPMSLIQCLTAIIKRKMKAVMIAQMPSPPLPLPEQTPVPPTSKDVVRPQDTWDDVKKLLIGTYGFSASDADEIIEKIQEFYDGSDDSVQIITRVDSTTSTVKEGGFDDLPVFEEAKRYKMTAPYCKDTWIPAKLESADAVGEGRYYYLRPPVKVCDTDWSGRFHMWKSADEDQKFDYENEWSLLKDYSSALDPV